MKKIPDYIDAFRELGGMKKDIVLLVLGGISLIISLVNSKLDFLRLPFDIAWVAIIICGIPIILEAVSGLIRSFDIKADVLVSIALIASVIIHEDFAAGEVAFIMQLGSLLENITVSRARSGIEKLVKLTPQTARVISGGERMIPAEEVKVGDLLRVLPGETVPVDGVIISGETSINQAVVTGESLPVDKSAGDDVFSGTINQFGAFDMKAEKTNEDSSIQRMIRLVQSADAGKAKIVSLADRWATWIVVIALSAAVLAWIISGEIIRAVTVLVVFCPCALVLATPAAIMAAIGNASKRGFLVREGDALERLAAVSSICFDKTGTLTYGEPKVSAVVSESAYSEEELFKIAASAELLSEHPLGKAIVKSYGGKAAEPEAFNLLPGEGVSAEIGGKSVLVGKKKLLEKRGVSASSSEADKYLQIGDGVVFIAVDNSYAGFIALSDTVRASAKGAISKLKRLLITPVLLTGDHENAARSIASQLDITEIYAERLPEEKLGVIDTLQKEGSAVCMIGDGINDAPALKKANVSIAMGKTGSDIAIDSADIALVSDDISEVPGLFALSKRMMKTIKQNLIFSMSLNFAAIVLALTGMLGPVIGALVHNAGSVAVIINSALLLKFKSKI